MTEEQAVVLRHHLALPFEAVEPYVPVWLEPPSSQETSRMSEPVREFYRAIDGRTTLGTLLSGATHEERTRRLDWLILQLHKRSLALLPVALEEMDKFDASAGAPEGRDRWWRRWVPGRS